jgi:hypothetical protein
MDRKIQGLLRCLISRGGAITYRLCLKTTSSARARAVFRLAKTAKQAISALSSMQPDAARWKISRSKPDRVFRQSLSLRYTFLSILRENPLYLDPNEPPACHMGDDRLFWIGQVVN